jgi:hypothetical protein
MFLGKLYILAPTLVAVLLLGSAELLVGKAAPEPVSEAAGPGAFGDRACHPRRSQPPDCREFRTPLEQVRPIGHITAGAGISFSRRQPREFGVLAAW